MCPSISSLKGTICVSMYVIYASKDLWIRLIDNFHIHEYKNIQWLQNHLLNIQPSDNHHQIQLVN